MTRYRDADGDTWESRPGDRVSLVEVAGDPGDLLVGSAHFTNVPRDVAVATHHLKQVAGGAR